MAHVKNNSGNNEWYTPTSILEKARSVLGSFDIDPASNSIAQLNVKSGKYFTQEDSGLDKEWYGNVWINPPYSSVLIQSFCHKLVQEVKSGRCQSFISLTNNATETRWFRDLYSVSDAFCFLTGRVRFLDSSNNAKSTPLQGQVLCYHGENPELFKEVFSDLGLITRK